MDRRQLGLLHSIVTSENLILQEVSKRQMPMKNQGSIFKQIMETMERYELPTLEEVQSLNKEQWKLKVKKAVKNYWTQLLQNEAETKSTLEWCAI